MLSVRRCMSDAGQAGIVGKYNAESPKKSSKRFNSITKTIYFAHLVILFIYVFCPPTLKLTLIKNITRNFFPTKQILEKMFIQNSIAISKNILYV